MTAPYPYDTQLALVASINATQTFLREGFFKPSYVKAVENLLNIWTKEVTNPKLIKMLNDMQQEEIDKLK